MSLVLLFHYLLLNMSRMLVHPSSGACDLLRIYFMGVLLSKDRGFIISVLVYWRVFSRDLCGCFNKRVSVNIGCCAAAANIYRNTLIKTTTQVTTKQSPLNKDANAKTSILIEQYT